MAQFEIIPVSGNADIPDVLRRIQTNVAKVVDQLTQAQRLKVPQLRGRAYGTTSKHPRVNVRTA